MPARCVRLGLSPLAIAQHLHWRIRLMIPRTTYFASFAILGLMLAGLSAVTADDAQAKKAADCCAKGLACCEAKAACCSADVKNGCCEKGMKCCEENRACCHAVQKCCLEGAKCCDEAKACCGRSES